MAEHIFGGNWTVKRVTFDTNRPNGVLLSADQTILYVAESPVRYDLRRELRAYPIKPDGTLGDGTVLFDFGAGRGIDGMALTTDGQILATAGEPTAGAGSAIYVFEPDGLVRATHRTPAESPTNCTFGGPGFRCVVRDVCDGARLSGQKHRHDRPSGVSAADVLSRRPHLDSNDPSDPNRSESLEDNCRRCADAD